MDDFLLFFCLQGLEQQLPRIHFQTYRTTCFGNKIMWFELSTVN